MNPLTQIKKIIATIDSTLDNDARSATVQAYWKIGGLTMQHKDHTGLPFKAIANEVAIPVANLQYFAKFYRLYRDGYPQHYYNRVISWSFFRDVLPLPSARERAYYLKEACRHQWSRHQMVAAIRKNAYAASQHRPPLKATERKASPSRQRLYTYAGAVIKVIDGDTLDIEIDVGFKLKHEHRVRLRGINCPEIGTVAGQAARAFVEQELNGCVVTPADFKGNRPARPLVVLTTHKRGLFGRYIADLYYLKDENDPEKIATHGQHLNQVLVERGHAQNI